MWQHNGLAISGRRGGTYARGNLIADVLRSKAFARLSVFIALLDRRQIAETLLVFVENVCELRSFLAVTEHVKFVQAGRGSKMKVSICCNRNLIVVFETSIARAIVVAVPPGVTNDRSIFRHALLLEEIGIRILNYKITQVNQGEMVGSIEDDKKAGKYVEVGTVGVHYVKRILICVKY